MTLLSILGRIALSYIVIGLSMGVITYIGSEELSHFRYKEDRIALALVSVFIWPTAVYQLIQEVIEDRRYRRKK